MDGAVPVELFVMVCEALEVAHGELQQMTEMDSEWWPVPDDLQAALDERLVLLSTLNRIRLAAEAGKQITAPRIVATYKAQAARNLSDGYRMPPAPVFKEVVEQLDDAYEQVRRRALWDTALADAVRQIETKGWAW